MDDTQLTLFHRDMDDIGSRRTMGVAGLGNVMSVNASGILAMQQRHEVQVMATAASAISMSAVLCAIYWFALMRRNFRRDLVLLLIMGDFWKSMWYMLQACVTFTHGQLKTESAFCQVGGYMTIVGIASCGECREKSVRQT
jgi:G protein-coupled receptor GPR1